MVPTLLAQFTKELSSTILNVAGYEAILKLRCSSGLTIESYVGNFTNSGPTDIVAPAMKLGIVTCSRKYQY